MKYYQIIIIIILVFSSSVYATECYYVAKPTTTNPFPELSPQGECGKLINQDTFQLKKEHFDKLSFSNNDLAVFLYGSSIFYVSKSGKIARTHLFDNGPIILMKVLREQYQKINMVLLMNSLILLLNLSMILYFLLKMGRQLFAMIALQNQMESTMLL